MVDIERYLSLFDLMSDVFSCLSFYSVFLSIFFSRFLIYLLSIFLTIFYLLFKSIFLSVFFFKIHLVYLSSQYSFNCPNLSLFRNFLKNFVSMFFFDKFEVQLLGGVISGYIVELQITPPNITAQIFLVFEMWRFCVF